MKHWAILGMLVVFLACTAPAVAGDKGHGSMPGMKVESPAEGHAMMAMGHRVFEGEVGPWSGEIRLVDMKAQMEKSKVSAKMKAMMKNTHHLMVSLIDPGTKKHVTEGTGSVTVTGPDEKKTRYDFMGMQGHFGADVTLETPGKYEFVVDIESGGKKGKATFDHEIK